MAEAQDVEQLRAVVRELRRRSEFVEDPRIAGSFGRATDAWERSAGRRAERTPGFCSAKGRAATTLSRRIQQASG
jgi:hypothetical protein